MPVMTSDLGCVVFFCLNFLLGSYLMSVPVISDFCVPFPTAFLCLEFDRPMNSRFFSQMCVRMCV